jgi:hypothetical protein
MNAWKLGEKFWLDTTVKREKRARSRLKRSSVRQNF